MSDKKHTKCIIDKNGDFMVVEISEEEAEKRKKELQKMKQEIEKEEDQSGRLAANWFRD
jgi:tRNA(Phe) wybutosine-synthesizing methylase Tyw3